MAPPLTRMARHRDSCGSRLCAPPHVRKVTVVSASLLLGGYLLFVLAVFGADLWHIIRGGLSKCAGLLRGLSMAYRVY